LRSPPKYYTIVKNTLRERERDRERERERERGGEKERERQRERDKERDMERDRERGREREREREEGAGGQLGKSDSRHSLWVGTRLGARTCSSNLVS
jgi:hypothetical protein